MTRLSHRFLAMRHPISILKCVTFLSLVLITLSPLTAQRYLTGTVVEKETGRGIAGATVMVNGQTATTASSGSFSFELAKVFDEIPLGFQVFALKEGYDILTQQVSTSHVEDQLQITDVLQIQPNAGKKRFIGVMFDDSTGQVISDVHTKIAMSSGTIIYEEKMDQSLSIPEDAQMSQSKDLKLELSHPDYHTQEINMAFELDGYEVGFIPMRQGMKQPSGSARVRVEVGEESLLVITDGLEVADETIRLRLYHKGNPIDVLEIENKGYVGSEIYRWPLSPDRKWKGKGYQIHAENLNALSHSFSIGKSSRSFMPLLIGAGAVVAGGGIFLLVRKLPAFPPDIPE